MNNKNGSIEIVGFIIIILIVIVLLPFLATKVNEDKIQTVQNHINVENKIIRFNCVNKNTDKTIEGYEVKEVIYDGCQYIVVGSGDVQWGTHKGNCNNPIHQYRIEK